MNDTMTMALPEEIKTEIDALAAVSMEVTDDEMAAIVAGYGKIANDLVKRIGERIDPLISNAHKGHKDLIALRSQWQARPQALADAASRSLALYQQRKREAESAERRRLEEIERRRREEERLAAALEREAAGDLIAAERIIEEEPQAVAVAMPERKVTPGTVTRETWDCTIDWPVLISAVVAGKASREWVMPNESAIRAAVRERHENHGIPGVTAKKSVNVGFR